MGGHFVFVALHLIALIFFAWTLFITIPLHLIYSAAIRSRGPQPTNETHVRCPDCRELIFNDAVVCRHCGCKLVPQPLVRDPPKTRKQNEAIAVGLVILFMAILGTLADVPFPAVTWTLFGVGGFLVIYGYRRPSMRDSGRMPDH